MSSAAWHARIVCGGEVGAGFLISPRRVLTCAHVVSARDASATVSVSFPHRRELGEVSATVVLRGPWAGGETDPGDLAVLELDREVRLAPAVFAPPGAERDALSLVVYGFPKGYDEGALAEYRALPGPLIMNEWAQLEATTAHGQPLAAGFSGAAVALADGRVVGMISAVAGRRDVPGGRMLPSHVMARYWPELGTLVPTPGHLPETLARLYALVRRAEATQLVCDPDRLYVDAVGPFGPPLPEGGFADLLRAARYVQWEVPDADAVTVFADRLAELLDTPGTSGTSGTPAPSRAPGPAWAPILVEIGHSGAGTDQVTVEVSAYRDGQRRPVDAARLPRSAVRAYVQERIDRAFRQLSTGADELITFVLPREWLDEPVAHWECSADDSTPLGCAYPLVVTERSRHHSGRLRHHLTRKWQKLDTRTGSTLHRIECGSEERPPSLRKRLRDDAADLAGFAALPLAAERHFEVGLNAPVPVLLWTRAGCATSGHDGHCFGITFLDALSTSVIGVPPAELPYHVRELRESAEASDEPDRHWAKDIQLLWDDPRCFPEPTAASLHSPLA